MRVARSISWAAAALAAVNIATIAFAAPVTIDGITVSDQNIFRDNRSINDAGRIPGDRFQFGVHISHGSNGYSGAGIFAPAAGNPMPPLTQALSACVPLSTDPLQCSRNASFNPGELNGTWSFQVQSASGTNATFPLPSAAVIPLTPVPFPASVTITNSADGANPTISWTLPPGSRQMRSA